MNARAKQTLPLNGGKTREEEVREKRPGHEITEVCHFFAAFRVSYRFFRRIPALWARLFNGRAIRLNFRPRHSSTKIRAQLLLL